MVDLYQAFGVVWHRTRFFIFASGLLILLGMVFIKNLNPGDDLKLFNAMRGSSWDFVFRFLTLGGEFAVYAIATVVIFFRKKSDAIWIPILGVVITGFSFLFKKVFASPRPGAFAGESWFSDLVLVEGVQPLTGMTSFPSGHTMGAFALAFFIVYLIPLCRKKWLLIFILAALVGVSRIYLVMHFMVDVLQGVFLGTVIAYVICMFHYKRSVHSSSISASN